MKDISDFISSVGFPIVVCLLMIYQQQKLSDSFIDIVTTLKDLISDNTNAINLLIKKKANVNDENKQETSKTLSDNQQNK